MKAKSALLVAGLGLLAAAVPLLAHHSFAAEFDDKKPVSLKGAVTKVEWNNPHIWFYVEVKDATDKVEHWQFEGGPPNMLIRQGWTKDSLKLGDEVTVEGFRAKDGSTTANVRSVTLSGGRRVFSGSAEDGPNSRNP
jgi:Family of unknown function (DUF6152)